jgi:hypothetical protein
MSGVGTRLRWASSAALAVVGVILAGSMLFERDAPSANGPVASQDGGTPETAGARDTPDAPGQSGRSDTAAPSADPTGSTVDPASGPPPRPDAALGLSVGSAEALVRYYFEQAENHLKLTGDGTAIRSVSSPACQPCRGEIAVFVETNGRNKRLTGDYLWKDVEVRAVRSTGARSMVVDVDARRGRHAAIEKLGARPTQYPGGMAYLKLTLIADGGNWVVFDMALR